MRIFIGSDIHGSYANAKRFFDVVDEYAKTHDDTKVILLGDIYNHGPRNPFPEEYAPMKVAELLNSHKQMLTVVKGNCDSEVDQMISEFEFVNNANMLTQNHDLLFTHGHKCSVYTPKTIAKSGDIVFYGHFHRPSIEAVDGVIYVCVGAVGLAPDGVDRAFAILDDNQIKILSICDGHEIMSRQI